MLLCWIFCFNSKEGEIVCFGAGHFFLFTASNIYLHKVICIHVIGIWEYPKQNLKVNISNIPG